MMSKSLLTLVALVCLALSALAWSATPEAAAPRAGASYVGATSCKKCHSDQHKTWMESGHGRAWDQLPEKYRDPAEVDESGKACVACHTTGFGEGRKGGFVTAAESPKMLAVQCEACHGPGSEHVDAGMELVMEKRMEFKEGEKTYITLTPTNCAGCHNPHVSHAEYK
jgi:hypothetical protein